MIEVFISFYNISPWIVNVFIMKKYKQSCQTLKILRSRLTFFMFCQIIMIFFCHKKIVLILNIYNFSPPPFLGLTKKAQPEIPRWKNLFFLLPPSSLIFTSIKIIILFPSRLKGIKKFTSIFFPFRGIFTIV